MISCMRDAMDEIVTRAVWELAYRVGARGRTAKKRRLYVQRTAVPTAEERRAYLAQEGNDGGCKAEVVDGGAVKGGGRAWGPEEVPDPEPAAQWLEEIRKALSKLKKR